MTWSPRQTHGRRCWSTRRRISRNAVDTAAAVVGDRPCRGSCVSVVCTPTKRVVAGSTPSPSAIIKARAGVARCMSASWSRRRSGLSVDTSSTSGTCTTTVPADRPQVNRVDDDQHLDVARHQLVHQPDAPDADLQHLCPGRQRVIDQPLGDHHSEPVVGSQHVPEARHQHRHAGRVGREHRD